MALNYPGPYQVRFFYTVDGVEHKQQLNTKVVGDPEPGTPMSGIEFIMKDTTTIAANTVILDWVDWMQEHLAADDSEVTRAELWKYTPETFDAIYVSAMGITGGTYVTGASTPAAEFSVLFRTAEGGIMRIVLEEPQIGTFGVFGFSDLPAVDQAMISEVVAGDTFPWLGRDTSYPIAFKAAFTGQNEKMFRVRYR